MREILFKAKHITLNKWYEGFYVKVGILHYICVVENGYRLVEIQPETLSQYTGLCDMNGKKIFENDIHEFYGRYWVIRHGCFQQEAMPVYGWYMQSGREMEILDGLEHSYCNIVGNVFDNPELIERE